MKILDKNVTADAVWFRVQLDRSTDVLVQELFTQSDIDAAKMEGKRELLDKILENNT